MDTFVALIEANWKVVLSTLGVSAIGIWVFVHWVYKERLSSYKDRVTNLEKANQNLKRDVARAEETIQEQLDMLLNPDSYAEKVEELRDYDRTWEKVDSFTIWEVAWLWIDKEPVHYGINPNMLVFPVFTMLQRDAVSGKLKVDKSVSKDETFWQVSRNNLVTYAKIKGDDRPRFLFRAAEMELMKTVGKILNSKKS